MCAIAPRTGPRAGSAQRMADMGREYAARAAVFRRIAADLRSEADQAALLAIAEEYEAESERLKSAPEAS